MKSLRFLYAPGWSEDEPLDEPEAAPDFEFHPDAMRISRDLLLVELAGWTRQQIEAQDENWLADVQTAHAIKCWASNRAHKQAMAGVEKPEPKGKRQRPRMSDEQLRAWAIEQGLPPEIPLEELREAAGAA